MRALWLLLACAGCATPQPVIPPVQIQKEVVEVQRPCAVTKPVRPAPLARPLPVKSDALIAVLASKLMEYAAPGAYADRADAAITTCTRTSPSSP